MSEYIPLLMAALGLAMLFMPSKNPIVRYAPFFLITVSAALMTYNALLKEVEIARTLVSIKGQEVTLFRLNESGYRIETGIPRSVYEEGWMTGQGFEYRTNEYSVEVLTDGEKTCMLVQGTLYEYPPNGKTATNSKGQLTYCKERVNE